MPPATFLAPSHIFTIPIYYPLYPLLKRKQNSPPALLLVARFARLKPLNEKDQSLKSTPEYLIKNHQMGHATET